MLSEDVEDGFSMRGNYSVYCDRFVGVLRSKRLHAEVRLTSLLGAAAWGRLRISRAVLRERHAGTEESYFFHRKTFW